MFVYLEKISEKYSEKKTPANNGLTGKLGL